MLRLVACCLLFVACCLLFVVRRLLSCVACDLARRYEMLFWRLLIVVCGVFSFVV